MKAGCSIAGVDRGACGGRLRWLLLGMTLWMAGCAGRPLPPWDLSRPGWSQREAAAVWTPRRGAPELTGELLWATHPDGSRLVQFSKQALPIVTARRSEAGWDIRSPLRKGVHAGRGHPPGRVLWFAVDGFPPSTNAVPGWRREIGSAGEWTLENLRTGERLEVVP